MTTATLIPAVLFYHAGGDLMHYETRTDPDGCATVGEALAELRRGRPAMVRAEDARAVRAGLEGDGE